MSEHPEILLDKNCPQPLAIKAYWLALDAVIHEQHGAAEGSHACCVTYLEDTDRITAEEATTLRNHPPPNLMAQTYMRCTRARREDGDLTLWTNPPKTWIKEPS